MSIFLKSCAYGTAAGAVLGLASIAISEDPSEKTGNIARGASLGLYAGIGFGLYTLYGRPQADSNNELAGSHQFLWLSALHKDSQLQGAQLNWTSFSF